MFQKTSSTQALLKSIMSSLAFKSRTPHHHYRRQWLLLEFVIGIVVARFSILVSLGGRVCVCVCVCVLVCVCACWWQCWSGSQHANAVEANVTVEGGWHLGWSPVVQQAVFSTAASVFITTDQHLSWKDQVAQGTVWWTPNLIFQIPNSNENCNEPCF